MITLLIQSAESLMILLMMGFEPGLILTLIFALFVIGVRAWKENRFQQGQEADEDREQLRLTKVEQLMREADGIVSSHMNYYKHLSQDGKKKFMARLRVILSSKKFYGKEGLNLTPEVEVLTAAAFVQVTFGLDNFRLDRFDKIMVYPDIFYNRLLDKDLKGSTSPSGVIRFSYRHLKYGYAIENDNINLAIHELAHALKVSVDEEEEDIDTHLEEEFAEFEVGGEDLRNAILEGKLAAIRKYASTNEHEFFACCTEYFFESPHDFKAKLPDLYGKMMLILRQDPTRTEYDYRLALHGRPKSGYRNKVDRVVINQHIEDRSYKWVQWMIGFGIFVGFPLMIYMTLLLESGAEIITLFFLAVIATGALIHTRKFLVSGYMSRTSFVFFLLFGWWPWGASVALTLNYLVPLYTFEVEEKVRAVDMNYRENAWAIYVERPSKLNALSVGVLLDKQYKKGWVEENLPNLWMRSKVYYGVFWLQVYGGYELEVRPQKAP